MRRKCRRPQMQLRQQGDQDRGEVPTAPFVIAEHGHHDPACREENVSNSLEASAICSAAMLGDRGDEECASFEEQPHFVSTVASSDLKCAGVGAQVG
ncbi:hypothetical protein ERJ75_000848200 [Trypanosoma vivax]|nr:hypothetical protein ERJ75_000848200 [Trypanosoma vivax]